LGFVNVFPGVIHALNFLKKALNECLVIVVLIILMKFSFVEIKRPFCLQYCWFRIWPV